MPSPLGCRYGQDPRYAPQQADLVQSLLYFFRSSLRHFDSSKVTKPLRGIRKFFYYICFENRILRSQVTTLQQAYKAIHTLRKRKRKVFKSDHALSVAKVQAMVGQDQVEAKVRARPRKRALECSKCGSEFHAARTCRIRE